MNKLKYYRKISELSQPALAEKSGVKLYTIQKLETGANNLNEAHMRNGYLLAKALGINMEDLLDLED